MKVQIKDLPKSQKEMSVEISVEEMEKYINQTVNKLSQAREFDGFRKGKAPKNIVEQHLGKAAIFEEATQIAIEDSYLKAIKENKLTPIGQPKAEITKAAAGNPFEYKIIISVIPEVKLGDYKKITGKIKIEEIKDDRVEREVKILRRKRASYITKKEPIQKGDRIEIDFESRVGGAKVEGGESKNHPLIVGDGNFVPGFEDKLIGMKESEKKEFDLVFPEDYYKKELAGKNVNFKVEVKIVQKVNLPELDDNFAKSLGKFESMDNLRKNIKEGMAIEEKEKAKEELRGKLVEQVCEKTVVEIPDVLIESELDAMINEFKNNISYSGIDFNEYLTSVKTNIDKLRIEWRKLAEKRAKTALVMGEIAAREKIKVDEKEVEEKANHTLKHYPNEEEIREKIDIEKFKDYISGIIANEKVFEILEKIAEENGK